MPAWLGVAFLVVPLVGLLANAPWTDLGGLLGTATALDALRLSLITASLATVVAGVLGIPLAWLLARSRHRAIGLLRALVTLPLVMPPVAGGVALLYALGRNGLVGRWLDEWFGITLPFTTAGVVVAEAFVAMPFLVLTVEGAFRAADAGYDEAAATLGASPLLRFWRVTLPLVRPSLVAGAVLCWARALGEFGATITFAGSFPGTTRTMPIEIYLQMQTDPRAATALALVLVVVSVVVLVALRERWWGASRSRAVATGPLR
ncbi:MAG: ABC transporter permease [Marmoricola sp.]